MSPVKRDGGVWLTLGLCQETSFSIKGEIYVLFK